MKLFFVVISYYSLFSICSSSIIEIDEELYNTTISVEKKLWLLYFYAPWCQHCKKFSPILDDIAAVFPSNLNIGKIDATKSKKLAEIHEIVAYPTIKFLYNEKYALYTGERKFDDLKAFISKIHDIGVKTVTTEVELKEYLNEIKYAFVLSISPSMKYSHEIHQFFIEIAEHMKIHANFIIFERNGPLLLQKLEVNRNPLTLQIHETSLSVEKKEIEDFIERHNHLLVTPLDKTNMRRLGRTGKPLIIAITKEDHEQSNNLLSYLDQAASILEIDEAHKFIFGHMNGIKYRHYLERYRGATPPSLLVLDLSVNGYYVLKKTDSDNVKDTVLKAISKDLPWIELEPTGLTFIEKIQWKLKQYYPWSLLCILPFIFLILSYCFPHPNSIKQKSS